MPKTQRMLDPIHGLIAFREDSDIDQLAWRLINTREFQRLRRIRQLGFSEMVFPGATHTRFSHCIGVYHTARQLLEVLQRKVQVPDARRVLVSSCAALLHDLGHGPFSHTFEAVEKKRGVKKRHEEWTADMIRGDTEVRGVLDEFDPELADDVALLLTQREPQDIYSAIVSSQFDADRLDYLRRDRYMTGAGSGGFDYRWLLDCLEVGRITIKPNQDEDEVEVDGLYLNHKGLHAAEGYLLARHHLYSQIYLHKTTRGAEAMLAALLGRVARLLAEGKVALTGLADSNRLVVYFRSDRDNSAYFSLDDAVVWASLSEMAQSSRDDVVKLLADGLSSRKLFKCFDAGLRAKEVGGDSVPRFRKLLRESQAKLGLSEGATLLMDEAKVSAYGSRGFDEPGALQNVLIGEKDHPDRFKDIRACSPIVRAVEEERLFRIYVPDADFARDLNRFWEEAMG